MSNNFPSPTGRGWLEGPGEGHEWITVAGLLPSSGPSGHLLPKGEGIACPAPANLADDYGVQSNYALKALAQFFVDRLDTYSA